MLRFELTYYLIKLFYQNLSLIKTQLLLKIKFINIIKKRINKHIMRCLSMKLHNIQLKIFQHDNKECKNTIYLFIKT